MRRIHPTSAQVAYWRTLPADKLYKLLLAERKRGLEGHWDYNLPRHREMLRVYREKIAQEETVS